VTVWSLLGAYDWNSLLTRDVGHYEAGAFDVRGGLPRPTQLARLAKHLAAGQPFKHPVLQSLGWWQRPGRVHFHPSCTPAPSVQPAPQLRRLKAKPSAEAVPQSLEYAA
jgi:dTDP-4-dehydrorhamnose reductase